MVFCGSARCTGLAPYSCGFHPLKDGYSALPVSSASISPLVDHVAPNHMPSEISHHFPDGQGDHHGMLDGVSASNNVAERSCSGRVDATSANGNLGRTDDASNANDNVNEKNGCLGGGGVGGASVNVDKVDCVDESDCFDNDDGSSTRKKVGERSGDAVGASTINNVDESGCSGSEDATSASDCLGSGDAINASDDVDEGSSFRDISAINASKSIISRTVDSTINSATNNVDGRDCLESGDTIYRPHQS